MARRFQAALPTRGVSADPKRSVSGRQVVLLEDLGAEPDATFADEEPRPGDQSRKVDSPRRVCPNRPAEFVAEGTSRRIWKLPTLGHREEHRQIQTASVPHPHRVRARATEPLEVPFLLGDF